MVLILASPTTQAETRDESFAKCDDALAAMDHPQIAIEACTTLIQSGQETAASQSYIYFRRGSAYDTANLKEQAIADYRAALKLNPSSSGALVALTLDGAAP